MFNSSILFYFACQLTGTLSWELCPTQGRQPKALGHTTAIVGDTLYIFGGIYRGNATNALYMLNTGTFELANVEEKNNCLKSNIVDNI